MHLYIKIFRDLGGGSLARVLAARVWSPEVDPWYPCKKRGMADLVFIPSTQGGSEDSRPEGQPVSPNLRAPGSVTELSQTCPVENDKASDSKLTPDLQGDHTQGRAHSYLEMHMPMLHFYYYK